MLLGVVSFAVSGDAGEFNGHYVSGTGDTDFLGLIDVAARQHSIDEISLQTVTQLYRGDWDGLMEGTGWNAWWTQNSYGPSFSALPFMADVEFAATAHSNAWSVDPPLLSLPCCAL